jgi:hypothetical protein
MSITSGASQTEDGGKGRCLRIGLEREKHDTALLIFKVCWMNWMVLRRIDEMNGCRVKAERMLQEKWETKVERNECEKRKTAGL